MQTANVHQIGWQCRYRRVLATLKVAKALGGRVVEAEAVDRLRAETAVKIRERAAILGKARTPNSLSSARPFGLGLKLRLHEHRNRIRARRVQPVQVAGQLRRILKENARENLETLPGTDISSFHAETATSVEPFVLRERLREVLGFETVVQMEQAGVRVETPLTGGSSDRVFKITFGVPRVEMTVPGSQITSLIRSTTGAQRVTQIVDLRTDLGKLRRSITSCSNLISHSGRYGSRTQSNTSDCCCCCCDAASGKPSEASRPSWSSVPDDTEWHLKQMRVKEAWGIKPPRGGKSEGEGILVAHPDTGWREHSEYDQSQVRFDVALNVLEGGRGEEATRHGTLTIPPFIFDTHGTGTGAMIVSKEANGHTHVTDIPGNNIVPTSSDVQLTGVAPKAEIVPIRFTVSPILTMDGNLHKAIEHAIDIKAHVISCSLGGILDDECERVINRAVLDHNIIVVAAAGQYLNGGSNSVMEPASFPNVIAIAGSTHSLSPWDGSCNGPSVAVSTPAQGIWFAGFSLEGPEQIFWGQGTSFSAAEGAGLAALWLAHWGRDNLIARYPDIPLSYVFRYLLRKTAFRPTNWDNRYGTGIADAYSLLSEPLPASGDVVRPKDSDDFNLFDAFSGWLDDAGDFFADMWNGMVDAGGAVGEFFGDLLNLPLLNETFANLEAIAQDAASDLKVWAEGELAVLGGLLDDALTGAGDAWDDIVAAGEDAVDAVGDVIEDAAEVAEDLGDGAADATEQVVDFFGSLFP